MYVIAAQQNVNNMAGRLYASAETGYVLLSVPNAIVHGARSAINAQGVEPPPAHGGSYRAHITVMRPEEVSQVGGLGRINERGQSFHYRITGFKEIAPSGWPEMSRVWVFTVKSPELERLRKSYGLSATPKNGEYPFHITVAVRRKKVLQRGPVKKLSQLIAQLTEK